MFRTLLTIACGLYFKKHNQVKKITSTSPKKTSAPSRRKKKKEQRADVEVTPSSPPPRELMSEIDHPLMSEGICLPRMGYLRGRDETDDETEKENIEPDDMERFFSDVLA